jgi:hypothetical protein
MTNNNVDYVLLGVFATMLCKISATKTLRVRVRVTKINCMSHAYFYMARQIKHS